MKGPENHELLAAGYRMWKPGEPNPPKLGPKHVLREDSIVAIAPDGSVISVAPCGLEANAFACARAHYRRAELAKV